jgi:protein ImuB
MFCCLCGEGDLRSLAFDFSPLVEQSVPNAFTFDASGLDRLFGLPQDIAAAIGRRAGELGARPRIAIAQNPDAAICAARAFPGVSIVPYGDEAKYLGELPVTALAPSPELAETLASWGIRSLRELAALPALGIAERLGPEGLKLRRLARGEVERKLLAIEDAPRYEEELELEYPVELLEPLSFLLARLLNGLITRLATRALSTNELRLRLRLENRATHERALRLPVPTLDAKAILKLMQLDLEAHPPAAPIVRVWMAANPVKPRAAQAGLFTPAAPEPVKLELTLARIRAIVGEDRAGAVKSIDTHRPDAYRPVPLNIVAQASARRAPSRIFAAPARRGAGLPACAVRAKPELPLLSTARLSLRMFRPPRPARVAISASHPTFVAAERIRGDVIESAGPWRTSGDWWTADSWSRDEWDVSLSDGGIYRVYCCPRGWFVEGSYD